MANTVSCDLCGVSILPATAARTNGRCMPCFKDPDGPRAVAHAAAKGTALAECRLCGIAILPATAARTEGRCMQCLKDPYGEHRSHRHAARTPTETLKADLERRLEAAVLRAAREGASAYAGEGIYGFFLFDEYFGMYSTAVFTEKTLDATLAKLDLSADTATRARHRWTWESELPHGTELDDPELGLVAHALLLQAGAHEETDLPEYSERLSVRMLRRVRDERIFAPGVLFSIGHWDQSDEVVLAYAELISDPATAAGYVREAVHIDPDHLRQYRERMRGL